MNIFLPRYSALLLAVLLSQFLATNANAIQPIPKKQGWSGYVLLGGGYTNVKSNVVVGNDLIDGGFDTVTSIVQKPDSEGAAHPLVGLEVKYTLPGRNQIFLGGSMEDRLTLDFANQLGWRKQTQSIGSFQLGALFSSIPVEVWQDPYLLGKPRKAIDRDSLGGRFEWGRIIGSSFDLLLQVRDNDLDSELSGSDPALGCDANCQQLLDRNGQQYQARLSYRFILSPKHIVEPKLRLRREDREGAAIARDAWELQLAYSYIEPNWIFVTNALYGTSSYDQANPLYGIRQDAETLSFDATVLYTLPTDDRRWLLTATLFWAESDSDIDFHDNKLSQVALVVIYNFGG